MNPGISFLDLLRRRRELPLLEVARLCADLPRELDERARRGMLGPLFLTDLFITVPGNDEEHQRLLEAPVTSWPPFSVRVADGELDDEEAINRTFATRMPSERNSSPVAMARLLYELLGGKKRAPGLRQRLPPLPALNEEGNTVLRQALAGELDRESCAVFWQKWLRACDVVVPSGWRIPRWLLSVAKPGSVLRLSPTQEGDRELALVARSLFRIGRSRSQSDYPTRVLTRSGGLDEETTVQVSRVQTVARWNGQGLTLQDGNGRKPSANGTLWNGELLTASKPTPFAVAGELTLGGVYRLAVSPAPIHVGMAPEIQNIGEWTMPKAPADSLDFSAVVFRPLDGQAPTRDAVWVGRGVGFSLVRDRGVVWDTTSTRSPAQFLYLNGCFWLANNTLENAPLMLNEATLEPGQIAPLTNAQDLDINGRRYVVSVDA